MNKQLYNFYQKDKLAFFSDHVMIIDAFDNLGKMELYKWKQQILYLDRVLVSKPRNVGLTEAIAAEIAYYLNFHPNFYMMYMSANMPMWQYAQRKVFRHFNLIPDELRVPLISNKDSFFTKIDSEIYFFSENRTPIKGQALNALYLDEVGDMNNFNEIYYSLTPCLKFNNSKYVISKTENNNPSYFDDLWKNNNRYDKIEIPSNFRNEPVKRKARKHSLNDINKTTYSKIIRECVI